MATQRHAPDGMVGRFRIMRLARDTIPFWCALVSAPIIFGLGAQAAGIALGVTTVVGFVVHSRRRLAVFDIDEDGTIEFLRFGPLEWNEIEEVSHRVRWPLATPRSRRSMSISVAIIRIHRRGSRPRQVAQGGLWQIRPRRRPLTHDRLSRLLLHQAEAAGFSVERGDADSDEWRATSGPSSHR